MPSFNNIYKVLVLACILAIAWLWQPTKNKWNVINVHNENLVLLNEATGESFKSAPCFESEIASRIVQRIFIDSPGGKNNEKWVSEEFGKKNIYNVLISTALSPERIPENIDEQTNKTKEYLARAMIFNSTAFKQWETNHCWLPMRVQP